MSSFFTLPASQRKRKRDLSSRQSKGAKQAGRREDDSISGSEISDDNTLAAAEDVSEDDDLFEDEDPAAKRVRLAEQYLANTQKEVIEDEGFDAAEIDQENLRHRMGERLKLDTAEGKGKVYRWISGELDWRQARKRVLRCHGLDKPVTGVALHDRFVFAVSKDMHVVKWELVDAPPEGVPGQRPKSAPRIVARSRGNRKNKKGQHHHGPILCIAVSSTGKFVATGGADKQLIIWDSNLKPLKVFHQHRDEVTALAFRQGTNQVFSASKDRTIKIWSLDELAYVDTLYGHQDQVVDVDALAQEKCVSVGARDRTARLWKVVEEAQLVFRGGGAPSKSKALRALQAAYEEDSGIEVDDETLVQEGSTDRIAMLEDETFITASDNGSISLWSIHKKKSIFTLPFAHGLDPPLPLAEASAELIPDENVSERSRGGRQPRWITALRAIPLSDTFVTGSWDGYLRAWKVSPDKRQIESLGVVGAIDDGRPHTNTPHDRAALEIATSSATPPRPAPSSLLHGVVNDLAITDRGERGKAGIRIAAALGKEHRLGRWREHDDAQNRVVLFDVPKTALGLVVEPEEAGSSGETFVSALEDQADFEGFA